MVQLISNNNHYNNFYKQVFSICCYMYVCMYVRLFVHIISVCRYIRTFVPTYIYTFLIDLNDCCQMNWLSDECLYITTGIRRRRRCRRSWVRPLRAAPAPAAASVRVVFNLTHKVNVSNNPFNTIIRYINVHFKLKI